MAKADSGNVHYEGRKVKLGRGEGKKKKIKRKVQVRGLGDEVICETIEGTTIARAANTKASAPPFSSKRKNGGGRRKRAKNVATTERC